MWPPDSPPAMEGAWASIAHSGADLLGCSPPQVEEFRKKDAEQGVKVAQVLQGFISRKVVKQTVMTVVYGVTRYGGRLQMEKRLKEIDEFPEVACLPQPPPAVFSSALSPCWEKYLHCPSCGFPSCLALSLTPQISASRGMCRTEPPMPVPGLSSLQESCPPALVGGKGFFRWVSPHPSWTQFGGMTPSAGVSDAKQGLWLCCSLWKWPLSLAEFLEACSS